MGRKDKEDLHFEIQFYEGVLKERPYFLEALIALGDLYTRVGRYEDGLKIDERLFQLKSDDPVILYNLSCSYSLTKKLDAAFETLKSAFKFGYEDLTHLEVDPDLENLRKDHRFPQFLSEIKYCK